jgi:hypothetical protein
LSDMGRATMSIGARPNPPFELFDLETAAVMGLAFDTAWQVLLVKGSELSSFRAEETREVLARRIITLTQRGERDVFRLHDDAIAHVRRLADEERRHVAGAQRRPSFREVGRGAG